MLKPDSEGVGLWRKSVNGIGRQRGDFQIRISLEPSEKFDAGVAIDDLGKHMYIRISKIVTVNSTKKVKNMKLHPSECSLLLPEGVQTKPIF